MSWLMYEPIVDLEGISTKSAAIVGAVAWVLGAVLTVLLTPLANVRILTAIVDSSPIAGPLLGYQQLHNLLFSALTSGGGLSIFNVVPAIVLLGAGFYVASQDRSGYQAGIGIAIGYLPLAVLSSLLAFRIETKPMTPFDVLLFAGIVAPVVFGGIGGLVANRFWSYTISS